MGDDGGEAYAYRNAKNRYRGQITHEPITGFAKVFTKILIRIIGSRRVRLIGIAWLIDIVRAIRVVWAVGIRIIRGVRISWFIVRIVFDMNNGVVC